MFAKFKPSVPQVSSGALPEGGVHVIDCRGIAFPATVSLVSAAAGRKIELSPNGVNFYDGTLDVSNASMLVIAMMAPVAFVKLTGAAGDTWDLH